MSNTFRIITEMNNRAKLKAMVCVSAALVCLYMILPDRGQAKPRTLVSQDRDSQNGVVKFDQAPIGEGQEQVPGPIAVRRDQALPAQGGREGRGESLIIPPQKPAVQRPVVLNQGLPSNSGAITKPDRPVQPRPEIPANPQSAQQHGGPAKEGVVQQEVKGLVDQPEIPALLAGQLDLHPDVNIVSSSLPAGSNRTGVDCVPLPMSPRAGVKICIYPINEDKWVSGSLKMNRLWEEDLVLKMQAALQADPSMMLVDLGSNLGMYALFAAAMGRTVLAVEMLPSNVMMIQRSLTLSGLAGKVLIINNALYRDHRTLQIRFMANNIGGSRLNTSKVYENVDSSRPAVSVRTICLDDLGPLLQARTVFLKMDIENSEHHALACAHSFFRQVKVKVVQIEWLHRTPEEAGQISDFLFRHGFALSQSPLSYLPLPPNTPVTGDVYFLNKSAFGIV
ncbi:hypothetical protein EGW08_005249 [Elysia chlorotica]|uniref:Methyltransferase FkbM domain-containing protein n=1 Tax=Elysia chlorotica TaxID=188477 RepID=A0A3S0ZZP4_ELYCH|nr:hypothetical protein EGW08_005249 [Elysia chlorotica]